MSRRRDGLTIGLSFVDTLTCGLGSLLILWLALSAERADAGRSPGKGAVLVVRVVSKEGVAPAITVRARVGADTLRPTGQVDRRIQFTPNRDGTQQYVITLADDFAEQDELYVYLSDLRGSQPGPVSISYSLIGPRLAESLQLTGRAEPFDLTPERPLAILPLRGLNDASQNGVPLAWRHSP